VICGKVGTYSTGMPDVEPAKRITPSPEENQCDVCVEPKMDIGDKARVNNTSKIALYEDSHDG
jgi:hypothetical protein